MNTNFELNAALGVLAESEDETELVSAAKMVLANLEKIPEKPYVTVYGKKSQDTQDQLSGLTSQGNITIRNSDNNEGEAKPTFEPARIGNWRIWRQEKMNDGTVSVQHFRDYHDNLTSHQIEPSHVDIQFDVKTKSFKAVVDVEYPDELRIDIRFFHLLTLRLLGRAELHLTGPKKGTVFEQLPYPRWLLRFWRWLEQFGDKG